MARAKKPLDQKKVSAHVATLIATGTDRAAFDRAVDQLDADAGLSAAEVIAIATGYNRGGVKPSSRAKAMALIKKRFVEVVRTDAKNRIAEKSRPW